MKVPRLTGALSVEQCRPGSHKKTARTKWSKEMNVAVMESYFFSRPFHEEGKPIRGYRKRMQNIWKERQGLKVTEKRLSDQARMIRTNGWQTELEINVTKKGLVNENPNKNDQNNGNDNIDDQREVTENECENLVNFLQNNVSLSFLESKGND